MLRIAIYIYIVINGGFFMCWYFGVLAAILKILGTIIKILESIM